MTLPERAYDVVIVGGGTGATAAALTAAESGVRVCLLTETDWLGGQMTAQGVSALDEHRYVETFGGTARYYAFRNAVRRHYQERYGLSPSPSALPAAWSPGTCWAGRFSYEPRVGATVLEAMLWPYVQSGQLDIYPNTRVVACTLDAATRRQITALTVQTEQGQTLRLLPELVLDGSDAGDLLPLCGREGHDWVQGAESRADTGEPDAPEAAQPEWVQPLTLPFALDWSPATCRTNRIPKPLGYARLRSEQRYRIREGVITGFFQGAYPWWSYRQILSRKNVGRRGVLSDLILVNTPSNDVSSGLRRAAGAGGGESVAAVRERARAASLGYIYWLQTECPREDDPTGRARGYPELRLRQDIFDTPDGFAPTPYVRESRRILALRRVREQEIVVRDASGRLHLSGARAAAMPDTVGLGYYALDIHASGPEEPVRYLPTRPFQIPLGALIPVRLNNLLPASKNLGTTHLTNGAYRLHPIEWNIGEAAGRLAAFCLKVGRTPREVFQSETLRFAFQRTLLAAGVPLHWYVDVGLDHPAFLGVQTLACRGVLLSSPSSLQFRPDAPLTPVAWKRWTSRLGTRVPFPKGVTRAEAAIRLKALLETPSA